jgi:hypothetical protein
VNIPDGVKASLEPNRLKPGEKSSLTLSIPSGLAIDEYKFTLIGEWEGVTKELELTLLVYVPTLFLTPTSGYVGDVILVTGKEYSHDTNIGRLLADGNPQTVFIEEDLGKLTSKNEIITSISGSFKVRVQVPRRPIGQMTITVGSASTTFEVKPSITIEINGTKAILSGYGFAKDERVSISFGKSVQVFADENGCWQKEFTVVNEPDIIDVKACGELSKQCAKNIFRMRYNLARGWNLISFPGDLVDSSPKSILGGSVTQIWNLYSEEPKTLTVGEGYWVLAWQNTELQVQLSPKEQFTRTLLRGWNLIGSIFYEAEMPVGVAEMYCWNAKTKKPEGVRQIQPGVGYWALVIKDTEITVESKPPEEPKAPAFTPNSLPLFQLPIIESGHFGVMSDE